MTSNCAEVSESGEAFAPRFIRTYLSTINENPWIPQILIREVVSRDTPLRQLFIDRFASRALKIVPPKVMAEIESGRMRQDLDDGSRHRGNIACGDRRDEWEEEQDREESHEWNSNDRWAMR